MKKIVLESKDITKLKETEREIIECLPPFIERYGNIKEFISVKNHEHIDATAIPSNSLLVYNLYANLAEKISISETVDLTETAKGDFSPSVFDIAYNTDAIVSPGTDAIPVVRFLYEGKFIGDFYIPKKSLVTSDVSDHESGYPLFEGMLDWLVKRGHIEKGKHIKMKTEKPEWSITLGSDPEYEVIMYGRIVNARDVKSSCFEHGVDARIGTDGHGAQVEFRPGISPDENDATEKMKGLFEEVENISLGAKGDTFPLGGHLHIGIVDSGGKFQLKNEAYLKLVELLDHYIGHASSAANGTMRGGYRGLSLHRLQTYGLEYRTPPAAIASTPTIYRTAMKICKTLTEKLLSGEEFNFDASKGATKREYRRLGLNMHEIARYLVGLKGFTSKLEATENIVKFWLDSDSEEKFYRKAAKPRVETVFDGIWSDDVVRTIKERIIANKKTVDTTVGFYGMKRSRGRVFSGVKNTPEGYGKISVDYVNSYHPDMRWIGFPYDVRNDITMLTPDILEMILTEVAKKES